MDFYTALSPVRLGWLEADVHYKALWKHCHNPRGVNAEPHLYPDTHAHTCASSSALSWPAPPLHARVFGTETSAGFWSEPQGGNRACCPSPSAHIRGAKRIIHCIFLLFFLSTIQQKCTGSKSSCLHIVNLTWPGLRATPMIGGAPLHCHSMTAPRLLKIDRGELGQKKKKKHADSDQKTQLGHVDAHEKELRPSRPRGHAVKSRRWGSRNPISLDAIRFFCYVGRRGKSKPHTD